MALVLLEIAPLAMVQRTIDCVAAGGPFGRGKPLSQDGDSWQKHTQKGYDSREFANRL
jgi:hypothetical protein